MSELEPENNDIPQLPDEAQMNALLTGETLAPAARVTIALAWWAGLSTSEIQSLRWAEIDEVSKVLIVGKRTVPCCPQLALVLNETPKRGPYVVYSRRKSTEPTTRKNLADITKKALENTNLCGLNLRDMRYAAVLRWLDSFPQEEVCRMTGMERVSLHRIASLYGHSLPAARREEKLDPGDTDTLSMALTAAGDTMETRAIYLSWQGNLLIKQMQTLTWEQIDLGHGVWQIEEGEDQIPSILLERMWEWKENSPSGGHVLTGVCSGAQLEPAFINRRIGEFFISCGLGNLSLRRLRGEYQRIGGQAALDRKLFSLMQRDGTGPIEPLATECGVFQEDVRRSLRQLEVQGLVVYSKESHLYHLPGYETNWERVLKSLAALRAENRIFAAGELAERSGLRGNGTLTNYYLNRALTEGLVTREPQKKYRAI